MDLLDMESYVTLCSIQNYTRAAEHLFISQSALSKRIANMEKELGAPLINRANNEFSLTPFGVDFLVQCNQLLSARDSMRDRVKKILSGIIKPLTIYHRHLPTDIVAPCITEMAVQHPEVEFHFRNYHSYTDLAELLIRGQADIILGIREDFEKYQGINYRIIDHSNYGMLVSVLHPFYNRDEIFTSDLKDEKIVFFTLENLESSHTVSKLLQSSGCLTTNYIYTNDKQAQLLYISTGKYIGFGGCNQFDANVIPGLTRFVPWTDCNLLNGDIAVACRHDDTLSKLFVDILVDHKALLRKYTS